MRRLSGKGRGALEVKFVSDEEVLKHIADDTGTALPAAPWALRKGSERPRLGRSPSPIRGVGERLWRAARQDEAFSILLLPLPCLRFISVPTPAHGKEQLRHHGRCFQLEVA